MAPPENTMCLWTAGAGPAWVPLALGQLAELPGGESARLAAAAGIVVAVLLLSAGALLLARRCRSALTPPPLPGPGRVCVRPELNATTDMAGRLVRHIVHALQVWLAESDGRVGLWIEFDQLVRELLTEHLGAARVRCYHVRPGTETLQTIAESSQGPTLEGPSARDGVLGWVTHSGKEYVRDANAAAHDGFASEWSWIWPVQQGDRVLGIVAVGHLAQPALLTAEVRQTVGPLLTLGWRHVACVERLHVVQRTDRATGVLTRNEFFKHASQALADSYAGSEPVVAAVLALEGLRRLDDRGCWQARDQLIEQIGQLAARQVRSDDVVGRFADDRFVILLRRLDTGLGRLIAQKFLATAQECIASAVDAVDQVRLRIGLADSGVAQPPLDALLAAAIEAVEQARRQQLSIAVQRPAGGHAGAAPSDGLRTDRKESAP